MQRKASAAAVAALPHVLDTSSVGRFKSWSPKQNSEAAAKTHQRVHSTQNHGSFYMERLDDKDTLFGAKGTPNRQKLESSLSLFTPQKMPGNKRAWSPQINDAWVIAHLQKGNSGMLASPPTPENLWSLADNRPTATGRELLHVMQSGYSAVVGNGNTPLGHPDMLFNPLPPAARFHGVAPIDHVATLPPELQRSQLDHLNAQFTVMEGHDPHDGHQILKDAFVTDNVTKHDVAPFPALNPPRKP